MSSQRTAAENALIAGILANRDEDTGYLVYADYLTERGNSHGDYIRVCVERSRLPPDSPERSLLSARAAALVTAHGEEWFAPLGALGLRPEMFGRFCPQLWLSHTRGVIDHVLIDQPGFPATAPRLFVAAPFLRRLSLQHGGFDAPALTKVKQLAQIEELDLSHGDATADDLRVLFRSRHLGGLRALVLNNTAIGDEGVRHLCAWPQLARLETLNVSHCGITAAGFERLAGCERLAGLKRLKVGYNVVAGEDAHPLFCSPHLTALEELEIGNLNIDAMTGVGFGAFPKLRALDLSSAAFEGTGFALLVSHEFPALEVLTLNSTRLTPGNIQALAGAPCAARLRELHLDEVDTGIAGLAALVQGRFPKLETLVLSRNRLGARGAAVLGLSAKRFPALTNLKLWDCNITPEGVADLVRGKLTANLTALDLQYNKIGPAGAEALAKSRDLKKLKALIVDERSVGKKGRAALLHRFGDSVMDFR